MNMAVEMATSGIKCSFTQPYPSFPFNTDKHDDELNCFKDIKHKRYNK